MALGFNPPGVWNEPDKSYSQGVVQHDGRVIHITGQIAWNADNQIVGKGDVEAQARQCLTNIETILAAVGGEMQDIVSMTIFCTAFEQIPLISKVRSEFFPTEGAPVSMFIQAAALVDPDWLVEMIPVAVVPHERYRPPSGPAA